MFGTKIIFASSGYLELKCTNLNKSFSEPTDSNRIGFLVVFKKSRKYVCTIRSYSQGFLSGFGDKKLKIWSLKFSQMVPESITMYII